MASYNYFEELRKAIQAEHGCSSEHETTCLVRANLDDPTAGGCAVEIFRLIDHPSASRCYAWGYYVREKFNPAAILALPPIDSPQSAVQAAVSKKAAPTQKPFCFREAIVQVSLRGRRLLQLLRERLFHRAPALKFLPHAGAAANK
jgi:hypothetical protein